MENYKTCPACSQDHDKTIDDLKPMEKTFFPYLSKFKMKCKTCGKVWDLPEGFEK